MHVCVCEFYHQTQPECLYVHNIALYTCTCVQYLDNLTGVVQMGWPGLHQISQVKGRGSLYMTAIRFHSIQPLVPTLVYTIHCETWNKAIIRGSDSMNFTRFIILYIHQNWLFVRKESCNLSLRVKCWHWPTPHTTQWFKGYWFLMHFVADTSE